MGFIMLYVCAGLRHFSDGLSRIWYPVTNVALGEINVTDELMFGYKRNVKSAFHRAFIGDVYDLTNKTDTSWTIASERHARLQNEELIKEWQLLERAAKAIAETDKESKELICGKLCLDAIKDRYGKQKTYTKRAALLAIVIEHITSGRAY